MKTTSTPRPAQFLQTARLPLQDSRAPRTPFALWAILILTCACLGVRPAPVIASGPAPQALHVERGDHSEVAPGHATSSRTSSPLSPDGIHISSGSVGHDGKPEDWTIRRGNGVTEVSYPVSPVGRPEDWTIVTYGTARNSLESVPVLRQWELAFRLLLRYPL